MFAVDIVLMGFTLKTKTYLHCYLMNVREKAMKLFLK